VLWDGTGSTYGTRCQKYCEERGLGPSWAVAFVTIHQPCTNKRAELSVLCVRAFEASYLFRKLRSWAFSSLGPQ
jgi:hypothetical protein